MGSLATESGESGICSFGRYVVKANHFLFLVVGYLCFGQDFIESV